MLCLRLINYFLIINLILLFQSGRMLYVTPAASFITTVNNELFLRSPVNFMKCNMHPFPKQLFN